MLELSREFRRRGKTVIVGGPYATLSPERFRGECDILVRGELETVAETLFSDLRSGSWKREYEGGKPDLRNSPQPRWDLYPHHRAIVGVVQTSRGCPFECEFCDVIQYLGRKQRHKEPAQVIAELDRLYDLGYRAIFLADDNFTVYRARARELLKALTEWNASRVNGRVLLTTQLSIECSRDTELLDLCRAAGLFAAFIGIETADEVSLKEARKRQNLGIDLVERVERFVSRGIRVDAGMIVGFDADTKTSFERQYEFAMKSPIPIFYLSPLTAPAATPLFARLELEGRLVPGEGVVFATNIIPRQMTHEELTHGIRWLANRLYHPAAFCERLLRFIDCYNAPPQPPNPGNGSPPRQVELENVQVARGTLLPTAEDREMMARVTQRLQSKPAAAAQVFGILGQYMQLRYMYTETGIWAPDLARQRTPWSQHAA